MSEPIEVSLKSGQQIALARLQDSVVDAMLEVDNSIVMHGGTAIWRCYNGNRFSEDIDIYADSTQIKRLNENLTWSLSKRGAIMEHPHHTERVINISNDLSSTKLEMMIPKSNVKKVQKEYQRANGSKLIITTLNIEDFIMEKIDTYKSRRFVRDFYDIYHLVSIEEPKSKVKSALRTFLKEMEPPIDEAKLKDLIYVGAIPSFDTMVEYVKSR